MSIDQKLGVAGCLLYILFLLGCCKFMRSDHAVIAMVMSIPALPVVIAFVGMARLYFYEH